MSHRKKGFNRKRAGLAPSRTCPILFFLALFPLLWVGVVFAEAPKAPIHVTFATDQLGLFPAGWASWDSNPGRVYMVQNEGEKKFLHADARDASVQIGLERKWPLKEWPVLRWQWRTVIFPDQSDERKKGGGDSVLGLYVVFGHWPFIKAIKYIWSDTRPVGESFDSPFSSRTKIVVVRSGRAQAGTWVTEERDVMADYRRLFGDRNEAPHARGIAILTDSDNTHSHAVGDYGEIETPQTARERGVGTGP